VRLGRLARHRSTESTPGDRGRALGRAHGEPIANTVAFYRRVFREDVGLGEDDVRARGEAVGAAVGAVRPDLVEEVAGIAAGAGQPEAVLLAVNARTELLAGGALARGGAECSVAGSVAGGCRLAQNWDFHPDLAPSRLLWTVERPEGGWFVTFTEAGILAKTGLSDAGLAVALNFLASDADGGRPDGLPVHVLLRMLLDRCPDAGAAECLLRQARVTASAAITVATAGRSVCSYELTPRGVGAVEVDRRGRMAHTNHFVADVPANDLTLAGDGAVNSKRRLERVRTALDELDPSEELDGLGRLLSSRNEPHPLFRLPIADEPWLERVATLATVVYDVEAPAMWLRVGDDATAPLEPVPLPAEARGATPERSRPAQPHLG
jgi:isopenicillin-N N-acyltransferase like protein